jgi:predicted acylesterase/phospholipase RssA
MTTAFVLSGGASLGAIQVGMLQALAERRIKPDLVVGTSVGAFNAAWIASQPDRSDELAEIWRGLRRQRLFPVVPSVRSWDCSVVATTWCPQRDCASYSNATSALIVWKTL